ncbi:BBE domain-containing protein [Halobacteriaceae archaeon GCM10025711]
MRAPPAPFVPEAAQGERVCAMTVCYSGDPDDAEDALAPIRAVGDPVVDLLREQPYTELQSYLDATEPKGLHYYWKTEFATELADGLLSTMRNLAADCPIPAGQLVVVHVGGALNEHEEDDGVVGNRDTRYIYGAAGMWEPDEPKGAEYRQWVRDAWERLRPYSAGSTYINFQTADEGDERIRATYGDNYDRLVDVKTRYDPDNLFRSNRNVEPHARTEQP